ncbi:GNAT family N-acetyltransferase [Candidatus Korobacter versatilis]|nr:GNAT family N-acetyltransferase [Candidatus Koribacter versatilis]
MAQPFTVEEFRPEFTEAILSLIVGIQAEEFGVRITAAEQPDLAAIPAFYQQGSGNFWVATRETRVIGTIALKDIGNRQAVLRKMFVAPEARGKEHGVALALLTTLLDWARPRGVKEIFLGTTDKFKAAHRFYEKNGFEAVSPDALPSAFPRMVQDTRYYRRKL